MFKILSDNFFAVQRSSALCDVYTLGSRCEPVKCCTCTSVGEAISWVHRAEASNFIAKRFS